MEKKGPLGRGLNSLFRTQEGTNIPQTRFDILEKETDISKSELDISTADNDISSEKSGNVKKILTKSAQLPADINERQKYLDMYKKLRSKELPMAEKYRESHLSQKGSFQYISTQSLKPGEFQPRTQFDEDDLNELAQSVRESGILQPLLVRRISEDSYEIIAGERRWRAAKISGLEQVPVIIKVLTNEEAHTAAIVENIQREDLSPLEEAKAYEKLIKNLNYTQQDISLLVGKSRSYIANMIRLLSLPEKVLGHIQTGELTPGHARLLIGLEESQALKFTDRIVKNKLNVRNAERLLKRSRDQDVDKIAISQEHTQEPYQDPEVQTIETQIREALGIEVILKNQGNQGSLLLKFTNLNQLDDIIERLIQKTVA